MSGLRFNLLMSAFIALLLFLQYHLWFESGGVRDVVQLKQKLSMQVSTNEKLKQQNDELMLQIQHLQKNADATEARARSELGMVKKGETFYQIVK